MTQPRYTEASLASFRRTRIGVVLTVVAVLFVLVAIFVSPSKEERAGAPAAAAQLSEGGYLGLPPVSDGRKEPAQLAKDARALLGVILSRNAVELAPRFDGRLHKVHVRVGDRVTAGSVVAELDVPTLEFNLRTAEASQAAARVDLERAGVELQEANEALVRSRALVDKGVASRVDLTSATYKQQLADNQREAARVQVESARADVSRLKRDIEDAKITVPFDGVVAIRYADPGANIGPRSPVIRLVNMSELFVRFAVPEERAKDVQVGQRVAVLARGNALPLSGTVERVAPEFDAASHMIFVEAAVTLPPVEARISVGEMVHVTLEDPSPKPR